ncbi:GNAT family N-acetyltransferase [Brevibacterium moorei]|uniref:GNAT family N-acetyltransferase n=1 Tax=Brevibacterium moorei TaxID=2968457 RepID=UPI00211CE8F6|nr:GNAT family N-acetyltransferase [Brevibacterium sp. 68QC2CO]MCQ9386773.1 GNAT family N-acetyltransferase [Brevibacterium sp. 68QC2CO]
MNSDAPTPDAPAAKTPNPLVLERLSADSAGDRARVLRLLESDPGYSLRTTGNAPGPDDARAILHDLPPGLAADRKTDLGLCAAPGGELIALADVLWGWPEPGTAHIGLLMVAGHASGRGNGRILHERIVELARRRIAAHRNQAIDRLRLAIVDSNATVARPFWEALGYRPTGESRPYRAGSVTSRSTIWTLPVTASA